MYLKVVVALLGLLMLVPATLADPTIWGTEEKPELEDPEGDVDYSEAYSGEPHPYLDVLAVWFQYHPSHDRVVVSFKVVSTEALDPPPSLFSITCSFFGDAIRSGEPDGILSFGWNYYYMNDTEVSRVSYVPEPEAGGTTTAPSISRIPHEYTRETGAPGYHRFNVTREALLGYADEIGTLGGDCREHYVSAAIRNRDGASGNETFDLLDLRPAGPGDDEDEFLTPRSPEPTSATPAESVAVGLAASAAAVLVAFAWRRRSA